jgi:hypothetical protein
VIDFDALVLNKCENIFSIVCKFTFTVSKPGSPPVICRGIYSSTPVDVQLQNETIFSDQQTSLGIRLRDFPGVTPERGDHVEMIDPRHPSFGLKYWIGDSDLDGQGGAMLMLRTQHPGEAPIQEEDLEEAPNDGQMYVRQGEAWVVMPPPPVPVTLYQYLADAAITASDPGAGKMRWNNVDQHSATELYFDRLTQDNFDISLALLMSHAGDTIAIQNKTFSRDNQIWTISAPPIVMSDWFRVPVTFVSAEGSSTFVGNQQISVLVR